MSQKDIGEGQSFTCVINLVNYSMYTLTIHSVLLSQQNEVKYQLFDVVLKKKWIVESDIWV